MLNPIARRPTCPRRDPGGHPDHGTPLTGRRTNLPHPQETTASYIAVYAIKLVYWSYKLNDISQGQDETALWIVQLPFMAGAVLLAICFADNLVVLLATGRDNIRPAADGPPVE